ncbi:hypothetical protein GGF43_004227, partial [Coemansia sp. RSA 2618]
MSRMQQQPENARPAPDTSTADAEVPQHSHALASDRPFPRIAEKGEEDSVLDAGMVGHRVRRTGSADGDFTQNATIPAKAVRTGVAEGRGRSKSRGRQSAKL